MATVGSLTCDNAKLVSDSSIKSGFLGLSTQLLSAPVAAKIERLSVPCLPRTVVSSLKGKLCQRRGQMPPKSLTTGASYLSPGYLDRTYAVGRDIRVNASRDYYDDYEEEQIDLAEHKMLQKGAPGTYQAIVKSVMPVGFFLSMPSGRTAYLPARDLGVSGGVVLLEKVFKPGQELTVRIMTTGGGRDIVSMKKPEFAPPDDMEIITRPLKGQQNQPPPRSRQPYPRERRY